jgi:hypothetical protein
MKQAVIAEWLTLVRAAGNDAVSLKPGKARGAFLVIRRILQLLDGPVVVDVHFHDSPDRR